MGQTMSWPEIWPMGHFFCCPVRPKFWVAETVPTRTKMYSQCPAQAKNFWAWLLDPHLLGTLFHFHLSQIIATILLLFSRIKSKKRCTVTYFQNFCHFLKKILIVSWNLNNSFIYPHYLGFFPVLSPLCIIWQCTHPHCSSHLWKPLCLLLLMLLVFLGLVKASTETMHCSVIVSQPTNLINM